MTLLVWNNSDNTNPLGWGIGGDVFFIGLDFDRNAPSNWDRTFKASVLTNGEEDDLDDKPDTVTETASLRITFAAATKTLTAWFDEDGSGNGYSWTALRSVRIDESNSNWEMNDTSTFGVGLYGECDGYTVTAIDQVYADNFLLYGSVLHPPYEYTVTNGQTCITRFWQWTCSGTLFIPNALGGMPRHNHRIQHVRILRQSDQRHDPR
jgi:hypothetical protein